MVRLWVRKPRPPPGASTWAMPPMVRSRSSTCSNTSTANTRSKVPSRPPPPKSSAVPRRYSIVSPERRACCRAAASDFSDGSTPVTVAPSAASVSARMPPPHPTSRTRFPPNPPNTRRKYSTRNAFSSCSPAKGPASLHHTPGTRSTRRSYFSGSESPPRRGSWSLMNEESTSGGRLDVRERRHVEEPQARQAGVLVHLDEQQVGHAHDAGDPLPPHADVEHRLGLVLLHGECGVHLDRRHPRLRLPAREHDASVLGRLRDGEVVACADVVRPGDDVHAVDAAAGDVDHDERAVAALQVHRPVEPRRFPRSLTGD